MRLFLAPALFLVLALGLGAFSGKTDVFEAESGLYHCAMGARPVKTADVVLFNPQTKRDLALRVVYPASIAGGTLPTLVWSHGAFGSGRSYAPLTRFWASHGYVVIAPTHADSAMYGHAASLDNREAFHEWHVRPQEVSFVIDQLDNISRRVPDIAGRLDASVLGMGGHSFGAHTAELLAGAAVRGRFLPSNLRRTYADSRIVAFMMISPSGSGGIFDDGSFGSVERPVLVVSGDNDTVGAFRQSASRRRKVWERMPGGDKYLLWVAGAYHGFGGISGGIRHEGSGPADVRQVDIVRCTGLAFWDAFLKKRTGARDWLTADNLAKAAKGGASLREK